jgi:uncharacterized coiled-coil DUF342 family protein
MIANATERPAGFPVIHYNGTNPETLANQYDAAYEALMEALEKINETAPNQRDYYDEEFELALDAHFARMRAIRQVMQELSDLSTYCWLHRRKEDL